MPTNELTFAVVFKDHTNQNGEDYRMDSTRVSDLTKVMSIGHFLGAEGVGVRILKIDLCGGY